MENFDPSIRSWEDYQRVYSYSIKHSGLFWGSVAHSRIHWRKPWSQVSECDFHTAQVKWYLGAELNVAENCLDRHVAAGRGDHPALIWVGNEPGEEKVFSFKQLLSEVCRMSNALESLGIQKGDRVLLYLPNIPELAIAVLACARIGAIHCVVFGGFSAHSIQIRAKDCGAALILTAAGTYRGEKWIDFKSNVDEALKLGCPTVKNVVLLQRGPQSSSPSLTSSDGRYLSWADFLKRAHSDQHIAASHSANDPLFILYTSGSTGQPKGVLHTMGGYITYAAYTHEIVFQIQPQDVYWCTADIGWITGHSYALYGPLANGTTTVLYEGIPTHPDPGRFWEIVDRYKVTLFYSAPTAIRILASAGDEHVTKHSRKSLRTLGTVGEPINPEAWKWFHEKVGEKNAPIVDTWWQTETGGILISSLSGITPLTLAKPGSATLPLPGVQPKIVDDFGKSLEGVCEGSLVITHSWPGQMVGVYGDPKRFYETYFSHFPGVYFTGDGAKRDEEGYYWIMGRLDDVIKISGHRLGTAEIESACITHPQVAESAAVGVPDPVTGEALHLFVVLKPGVVATEALRQEVIQQIRHEVGGLAKPKRVDFVPGLPKTRSGKIMRRILKKISVGDIQHLGDTSTLAEPTILEQIISVIKPI